MAGSEILVGICDETLVFGPVCGYGGTAGVVAYAGRTGMPVRILWPEDATR
ncbi:hypothetical protein [Streptomyces noursei]|uniref:hypothetical protein n=1 Tax=Streptomyces noursei TaxID=1971 RepID=UPI0023B80547|nr:hypothetical protein [Streptomyces noursei]